MPVLDLESMFSLRLIQGTSLLKRYACQHVSYGINSRNMKQGSK